MKQPPRGATFEIKKMTRAEFLVAALQRLEDDIGTFFNLLEEHNKKSPRKVGFWPSIRILMPIVEAIANAIKIKPQELLRTLGVSTPYLAWDLFRHSLIHGDYLQHAQYKSKEVGWGVAFIGVGHVIGSGHIGIDPIFLYKKLCEYLKQEIAKNDQSIIEIEVGVIYKNPKKEIVNDFQKL